MLSNADRDNIAAAVAEAETRTSGEVVCVIAQRVSAYPEIPLAWATAAALGAADPGCRARRPAHGPVPAGMGQWVVGHVAAMDDTVASAIATFAAVQAIVFAIVWLFLLIPAVRRTLTPPWIKGRRVPGGGVRPVRRDRPSRARRRHRRCPVSHPWMTGASK